MGAGLTDPRSGFTWTPVFITYGDKHSPQMIRTPEPGHVEDRSVSSAFNPYLTFAAYLGAGLDGIRRQLDPGEPNRENAYALGFDEMVRRNVQLLPQDLTEVLDELESDAVIRASLGPIADERLAQHGFADGRWLGVGRERRVSVYCGRRLASS